MTQNERPSRREKHCLRFAVRDGHGFSPAGKPVGAGKEESLTVGEREGTNQIKVDVAESGIG